MRTRYCTLSFRLAWGINRFGMGSGSRKCSTVLGVRYTGCAGALVCSYSAPTLLATTSAGTDAAHSFIKSRLFLETISPQAVTVVAYKLLRIAYLTRLTAIATPWVYRIARHRTEYAHTENGVSSVQGAIEIRNPNYGEGAPHAEVSRSQMSPLCCSRACCSAAGISPRFQFH